MKNGIPKPRKRFRGESGKSGSDELKMPMNKPIGPAIPSRLQMSDWIMIFFNGAAGRESRKAEEWRQ